MGIDDGIDMGIDDSDSTDASLPSWNLPNMGVDNTDNGIDMGIDDSSDQGGIDMGIDDSSSNDDSIETVEDEVTPESIPSMEYGGGYVDDSTDNTDNKGLEDSIETVEDEATPESIPSMEYDNSGDEPSFGSGLDTPESVFQGEEPEDTMTEAPVMPVKAMKQMIRNLKVR